MNSTDLNLTHHFLIAMPSMDDPFFSGSVTYILQHDEDGAMGLIINRSIDLRLSDVFDAAEIPSFAQQHAAMSVWQGGPVSTEQGFILHPPTGQHWQGTVCNDHLCMTTSRDILESIATGTGPEDFLFCLGYSGWSKGQLEEELKTNAWLTVAAQTDIVFGHSDKSKYQQALASLGIDLSSLAGSGGHA